MQKASRRNWSGGSTSSPAEVFPWPISRSPVHHSPRCDRPRADLPLTADGIKVGIVTDLGYLPFSVKDQLRRCDGLMIESNHDLEMLRNGPYPWTVKQRVMSRVGHLSNTALAEFFQKDYDGQAAFLFWPTSRNTIIILNWRAKPPIKRWKDD